MGLQSVIYHTSDSGNHWLKQNSNISTALNSVYFVDDQHGWAVGGWAMNASGVILHTSDAGDTWSVQNYNKSNCFLHSVFFLNQHEGWIGGSGFILHTSNSGAS